MKKDKKRVSKEEGPDLKQPVNKRQRVDSILGNKLDEFYGYKRLQCVASQERKWGKIAKIMEEPETQLILF